MSIASGLWDKALWALRCCYRAQQPAGPAASQRPLASPVILSFLLPSCSIKAAGGFLIQVLPFAEDETIEALERNISAAGSVTDMLARGMGAADISEQLLKGLGGSDTGFQLTPR